MKAVVIFLAWVAAFGLTEARLPRVCRLPKEVGPCRGAFPRYYFNSTTGECEAFTYGGCRGNRNNFETLEACQATCALPVCEQPKRTGPCRAYFPRFYFNTESGCCEEFVYGGCDANDNNFKTLDDCRRECPESGVSCRGNEK